VVADFDDRASLAQAFRGTDGVYLVCSPIRELVALESNAIEACEASGVQRVVLISALGAGDYDKSFPSWHRQVEDKLKATHLKYCILRPNSFLQNIVAFLCATDPLPRRFLQLHGQCTDELPRRESYFRVWQGR
jgi:uncharacterized protein YbjT (DUF2867 family)